MIHNAPPAGSVRFFQPGRWRVPAIAFHFTPSVLILQTYAAHLAYDVLRNRLHGFPPQSQPQYITRRIV